MSEPARQEPRGGSSALRAEGERDRVRPLSASVGLQAESPAAQSVRAGVLDSFSSLACSDLIACKEATPSRAVVNLCSSPLVPS